MQEYFVGAHRAHWLQIRSEQPLFFTFRTLAKRKRLAPALTDWALDSGGYTELRKHGRWTISAADYARRVQELQRACGRLRFAAIQDWMCERDALEATGLTVEQHQRRTVASYLELRALAPDVPWMPVLQGWTMRDYFDHVEMYAAAGVDLTKCERVGVGSICRRKATLAASLILKALAREGLRLHAFGASARLIESAGGAVVSADSMAWSAGARHEAAQHKVKTLDTNSRDEALRWFDSTIGQLIRRGFCPHTMRANDKDQPRAQPVQLALFAA